MSVKFVIWQHSSILFGGTKSFLLAKGMYIAMILDAVEILLIELSFHKEIFKFQEVFSTFGVPFMLKIKHGEPFSKVKERILKKTEIPEKEFEKVSPSKSPY